MVKDDKVSIYAPTWFKSTWKKFLEICERDRVSASHLIRVWVEGYVRRKDPGNPQRPLTAYVPGHEDEFALKLPEILRNLENYALMHQNELSCSMIFESVKHYDLGMATYQAVDEISQELGRRGIRVWR